MAKEERMAKKFFRHFRHAEKHFKKIETLTSGE
jgi:hypothetical protein